MKHLGFSLAALIAATPLAALDSRHTTGLGQVIEESIGYVSIREGVILIETREGGVFCKFDVSDTDFQDFEDSRSAGNAGVTCIPYDVMDTSTVSADKRTLSSMIDSSVAYENVRDDVIILEIDQSAVLCRITLSDADFARYADEGRNGIQDARAVCIPADQFGTE